MKLRDAILKQFEPDIAIPLIEFGKSLSNIDAEFLVFMARKSLCLYDVLLYLGVPPIEKYIISDRTLDMRLDPFVGKKVALVDDTLILGTTLAKKKRLLENEANAAVTVHVFCVDKEWWCKNLLQPDSISLQLDHQHLMAFSTAEVRAMSLVPRPYLVDFPISRPIRIRIADSQCLLSSIDWVSFKISTELQDRNGINVFTFFPTDNILSELVDGIGESITSCLDIIKVRAYARKQGKVYWMHLLPIVTLKPLSESNIEVLFQALFNKISNKSDRDLGKIPYFAHNPKVRQRLVQYFLSAALGERFMRTISFYIGSSIETGYNKEETDRHYGPWLHDEMVEIGRIAFTALWPQKETKDKPIQISIAPSNLPKSIEKGIIDSLHNTNISLSERLSEDLNLKDAEIINLFTDFTEIFLYMYDTREIPARKETHQLGLKVLDATPEEAPHRDRLEIGIPWVSIVDHLTQKYGISHSNKIVNLFSLVLDLCNDLGIAVPVTCVRDGIVFRAYRHGENVRFSDGELALAYEAINGFLKATKRNSITHLVLEKLLVLLIKVGASKRFLEPLYGPSGVEGTVRIGFYLKGAVPILTRGPKDRADRDIWLSRYLIKRGVLKRIEGKYILGSPVEGNYLTPDAPDEAYELGNIIGMLMKYSKDPLRKNAPLSGKTLTILATCGSPRHATAAVQVEIDIFRRWYEDEGRYALRTIIWDDPDSLDKSLKFLIQSKGHEAIHAAKMKFIGYKTRQNDRTIENSTKFLETTVSIDLIARKWKSYWKAMDALVEVGEKERFDPWLDKLAYQCWEIWACLSIIEIALRTKLALLRGGKERTALKRAYNKLLSYNKDMLYTRIPKPPFVSKLVSRFQDIKSLESGEFNYKKAFSYAIKNIEKRIPKLAGLVESVNPIIEEFGIVYDKHNYKYMLWYDIIDSTGTKAGRRGKDLESYRKQIKGFKDLVNNQFHTISITARKKRCEIYCWNGDKTSKNDMKHVFFNGKFARRYVEDVVAMLLEGTKALPNVRVRIYIVPCNFVGTSAYRRESDTEVIGERFWEHWSRLLKTGSSLEKCCGQDYSFLLVATKELSGNFKIPDGVKWLNPRKEDITSEIELLTRTTEVQFGCIKT